MPNHRLERGATPLTVRVAQLVEAEEDAGRSVTYSVAMERVLRRDPDLAARHLTFTDFYSGAISLKPEDLSNLEDRRLLYDQLVAMRHPEAERFAVPAAGRMSEVELLSELSRRFGAGIARAILGGRQ